LRGTAASGLELDDSRSQLRSSRSFGDHRASRGVRLGARGLEVAPLLRVLGLRLAETVS
jgi:hypothetical protein